MSDRPASVRSLLLVLLIASCVTSRPNVPDEIDRNAFELRRDDPIARASVLLEIKTKTFTGFCNATLISPMVLITAAHCCEHPQGVTMRALVAPYWEKFNLSELSATAVGVEGCTSNPDFVPQYKDVNFLHYAADIAVVRLSTPLPEHYRPISRFPSGGLVRGVPDVPGGNVWQQSFDAPRPTGWVAFYAAGRYSNRDLLLAVPKMRLHAFNTRVGQVFVGPSDGSVLAPGNSGGGIFVRDAEKVFLLGVYNGSFSGDGGRIGVGQDVRAYGASIDRLTR